MPGAAWLKLLLQHVSDHGEHLVRYYGLYSNRNRGERKEIELGSMQSTRAFSEEATEESIQFSQAARSVWAQLIKKVCEVDLHICPHCGGEIRFLAVIEEAPVIERILHHVRAWDPFPSLRAPPYEGK